MESQHLKNVIEAALLAAGGPLTIDQLRSLFGDQDQPEKQEVRSVMQSLRDDYEGRGIELKEVASGYRVQVREEMGAWLTKLWEDRPPRYSRALMETLAIIAYRQPVTRGDVEEIRGVSVTTNIIRTLLERDWIKVVGHRDVPGKPAMFGTAREFLDYFGLKKLDDLPPLAELASMEPVGLQLQLGGAEQQPESQDTEQGEASVEAVAEPDDASVDGDPDVNVAEPATGFALEDDFDEDEDGVSDEELAAAMAATEIDVNDFKVMPVPAAAAEESGAAESDADDSVDVPPGAVAPLVGLNPPGEDATESASVASLDDARAAAAEAVAEEDAGIEEGGESAKVVPINKS